jgi:hypothetical protein
MINLIPLSYLNEACFLSLNVDSKKYQMLLKVSQDTLKEIIGGEFYEEIESEYDSSTLSTDNDNLYEGYIKDYLAWQTYYYYLKFANVDSTPTGIREFNDENSSIVSDVKMYALQKNVMEMVNRYKYSMINYLKLEQEKDSTKYPLFNSKCDYGFNFAITAVDKKSDILFKINNTTINNE